MTGLTSILLLQPLKFTFAKGILIFNNYASVKLPGGSDGKESKCSARDMGSILGSERSPGKGNGTLSSILAWRIPWTEEPGRLQSMVFAKSRTRLHN